MVWEIKEKVNNLVMPFIMKPWAVTPEKLTKLIFSKERQTRFKKKTTIYSSMFYDIWHHLLQFPKCLTDKTVK